MPTFYSSNAGTLVASTPANVGQSTTTAGTYTAKVVNKGGTIATITMSTSLTSATHDVDRYEVYDFQLVASGEPLVVDLELDANEYLVITSSSADVSAKISGYKND